MARNSRFRSTTGPTSGRPRQEKKKSWNKKRDDGASSFRSKRSPNAGDDTERRPRSASAGGFSKRGSFGRRNDERPSGPGGRPSRQGGGFAKKRTGFPPSSDERGQFRREGRGSDERKSFGKGGRDSNFASGRKPGFGPKKRGGQEESPQDRGASRNQRPFYKQGFGRKDDARGKKQFPAKSPGSYSREEKPERKERKSFVESRLEKQRKFTKPSIHQDAGAANPDGLIRLNKFISNSGVCSRREADELISMGLITVNGKSITELGYKVKPTDDVRYEGRRLKAEPNVYILLNKPKGYITTTEDPQERNTVMQLIQGACKERVYPVGRLDRNTSGLLLLTNDGELTDKLTHPSYNVKKIYKAELDKPLSKADFQKVLAGVELEEGRAMVDDLAVVSEDGKTIGIEIHIGWNRVIRRIFEVLGYEVVKLDRSVYATLDKKDLARGHWRFLRQDEIVRLKHFQ